MATNPNQEYLDQLVEEIEARGLADNTVKAYLVSVNGFLNHFGGDAADLGIAEIKKYQRYLLKEKKLAANTVNRHITAIKFLYIQVFNRFEMSQLLPRVKVPHHMPIVLSEQEVGRMIDSVHSIFWRALILVTYSAGLRQSEVRNLKKYDVDSERMVLHIRNGKGGRDRQAYLSPLTLTALRSYWKLYRIGNEVESDFLFIPKKNSHSGRKVKRLSHTAIGYIIRRSAELAGIKKKFTHIFYVTRLQLIF
jgi:integrase/recombinase XerD